MKCPPIEVLRRCLECDGIEFDSDTANHIASCSDCQSQLNQLSDDDQLSAWRDASQPSDASLFEEAAIQSVLQRMQTTGSTDRAFDTDAAHETLRIDDLKLDAALVSGDLGRLGNYRIVRQLGQGGMAVVLEAIDVRLGRSVALKLLRPDRDNSRERQRFVREAQALAMIKHKNVVQVFDVADPSDGLPYFVTELMHGTLRTLLQKGPLDWRTAAGILSEVADGLQAAHDAGLVHRDIKPGNVLLANVDPYAQQPDRAMDRADNRFNAIDYEPKLSDFGLARALDVSLLTTRTVGLSGTPAYMSPEQINTPQLVTAATDIYSLGVTLYEAISGELPFRGPAHAVLNQIANEDVPWPHLFNPQVPRELEVICLKALAREPHNRYASANQFSEDLRNWLSGKPILAKPPGTIGRFTRWCRRNPRIAGLSAAVLCLLLLLTAGSMAATFIILSSQHALQERTRAAESASQAAELAQAAAVESARQAAEQRRITLDTLNQLVGSVQTQLERRADTAELRTSLLTRAFEGLQSVTGALKEEEQIDRTMIEAHIKMANIKLDFSDRQSAIDQSTQAIELAEKALQRKPTNIESLRDLANALTTQFDIYYGAFAMDKAREVAERIATIREQVCEQTPDDPAASRALIVIKQRIADIQLNMNQVTQSLESYQSLIAQLDKLQARAGSKIDLRRDKEVLLNRFGNILIQKGDSDQAELQFKTSAAISEQLSSEDPDNIVYRSDQAFVLGRLALLSSKQGRYQQAVEQAQKMLDTYAVLIQAEPNRIQFRTLVGAGHDMLSHIHLAGGDIQAALNSESQSLETALNNCERDPSTMRYPAMAAEAAHKVADLYLRLDRIDEAEKFYPNVMSVLARAHQASDFVATTIEPVEKIFEQRLASFRLAMKGKAACRALIAEQPDIARVSLGYLIYMECPKSDLVETQQAIEELVATSVEKSIGAALNELAVRGLGRLHQRADASKKMELATKIVPIAKALFEANPISKPNIAVDPDTASLREDPMWQALFK